MVVFKHFIFWTGFVSRRERRNKKEVKDGGREHSRILYLHTKPPTVASSALHTLTVSRAEQQSPASEDCRLRKAPLSSHCLLCTPHQRCVLLPSPPAQSLFLFCLTLTYSSSSTSGTAAFSKLLSFYLIITCSNVGLLNEIWSPWEQTLCLI